MAALPVNNPRRILEILDSYLEKETRIVLFGRAALALGFGDPGARFGKTQDVDAILPTVEMARIEADAQFWKAIELTNKSLEPSGLYLSHLFADRQIALTAGWLDKIVAIPSGDFRFLKLFRPSSLDLILTKMMRNDREDLEDIRFIISQDNITRPQLELAFADAKPLESPELQKIFIGMQPVVREIAPEICSCREDVSPPESNSRSIDREWKAKMPEAPSIEKKSEKDREIEP